MLEPTLRLSIFIELRIEDRYRLQPPVKPSETDSCYSHCLEGLRIITQLILSHCLQSPHLRLVLSVGI